MAKMVVRTRIAPSPTGYPHLGSIYNAMFNKVWAVKNSGKFVFRLEDTDRKRFVEDGEKALEDALSYFNLVPDESAMKGGPFAPYRQSERLDIYKKYALELVEKKHAYYCFCSEDRLKESREKAVKEKKVPMYDKKCLNLSESEIKSNLDKQLPYVIRMKVPKDKKIVCKDLIRGDIVFDSNLIDDQVIIKSDGFPTYHLGVVVDDHLMEITHVIRGHGWIPSFPKQVLLYEFFGWEEPVFVHFPDILSMEHKGKLSKRHGHSSVSWYRVKGYLPEAMLNFLALLGWSHPESTEIFTFDEFMRVFELRDISANLPKLDLVKLDWMNGEYLRKLNNKDLKKAIFAWLNFNLAKNVEDISKYQEPLTKETYSNLKSLLESWNDDQIDLFLTINKERIKKLEDLINLNMFLIKDTLEPNPSELTKNKTATEVKSHLEWVLSNVKDLDSWSLENLKSLEVKIKEKSFELNWKVIDVFYPIRIAIAKESVSPPLFESIYLYGMENTIHSLESAIKILK